MSSNQHRRSCGTCRRRKIRCDLGIPECQRCFTTGRRCPGYDRNYTFRVTTSSNWPKVGGADKINSIEKQQVRSLDHDVGQKRSHTEPSLQIPLYTQLGQIAVVCDAFSGVFLNLLFPKERDRRQYADSPCGWITSLATLLSSRNETLDQGLLALYTGFVGRQNSDYMLINRSAELYSSALQSLRRSDIWVRQKPSSIEMGCALTSIMIFSRIELLAGQGANDGYMAHIKGGLHLVQRFSTGFPPSGLTRLLVQRLRYLGFYHAARHRRGFFMCHAPYNTLCLAKKEDPDYLTHKAIEAVITLPTICEHADKLDATAFLNERKVRRGLIVARYLLDCTSVMEYNLDQWFQEMTAVTVCPIVTAVEDIENPRPQLVGVAAAKASDLWMLHWSLEIRLNLLIKQLQSRFASLSTLVADSMQLPARLTALGRDYGVLDQFADNIKMTLASGLADNTLKVQGVMAYFFNLHWYWEQRNNAEKKHWCLQALQDMVSNERLALHVREVKNSKRNPSLSAAFLADDFL
ncbi:hypothetical protein V8C35DRAFT_305595 [Trichoderma chlorosporum]